MKEDLFITSNYFASISDVIYSSREEFNDEKIDEKEEIMKCQGISILNIS